MTTATLRRPRRLEIAMIGQKGVPARHGGIERHVEEIGSRLVDRGHRVVVYCRPNYVLDRSPEHRGMELRHLPTLGTKHFDAAVHSVASTASAVTERFDVVHYHAVGPGAFAVVPRAARAGVVVQTIHGLDQQRAKWGPIAKRVLRGAAWLSERVPHAVVGVSRDVVEHYRRRGVPAVHVPNGVPMSEPPTDASTGGTLARYGLRPRGYVLFVGRLVPEKGVDVLVDAFSRLAPDLDLDLAIVGGSSFTDSYEADLCSRAARDARVRLLGYVYGGDLSALYSNAAVFVIPSMLEGLPLTLLEALAHRTPVVASAIGPHLEVLGGGGPGRRLADPGCPASLAEALAGSVADPDAERHAASAVGADVVARHSWDAAAGAHESLYLALTSGRPVPAGSALYEGSRTVDAPTAA